jgi:hypothetical protein
MTDGIEHVCKTFKNRAAGTKSEADCQAFFAKQLGGWSDEVRVEPFRLNPNAFLGWIIPVAFLTLVSIATFWIYSVVASWVVLLVGVICTLVSLLMYVYEFGLYREFVDGLYEEAFSHNVYAARRPKGETKRRIIFGGHADAPYELTYSFLGGKNLIYLVFVGATIGMMFVLITNIIHLVITLTSGAAAISGIWLAVGILDIVAAVFLIAMMFFNNWYLITDGANDNLTGCYVAMSILREMSLNDERLENTEVCCFLSGGEESGLRGALHFARNHKNELEQIETIFIALDTLRETNQLQVYTDRQNGLQKNCKEIGNLLQQAGKACGYTIPVAKPYPGATDAEAFSRFGLKSCGFCGLDHNIQPYYHTRCDTWTNISPECLEVTFNICREAIKQYDKSNGIDDFK